MAADFEVDSDGVCRPLHSSSGHQSDACSCGSCGESIPTQPSGETWFCRCGVGHRIGTIPQAPPVEKSESPPRRKVRHPVPRAISWTLTIAVVAMLVVMSSIAIHGDALTLVGQLLTVAGTAVKVTGMAVGLVIAIGIVVLCGFCLHGMIEKAAGTAVATLMVLSNLFLLGFIFMQFEDVHARNARFRGDVQRDHAATRPPHAGLPPVYEGKVLDVGWQPLTEPEIARRMKTYRKADAKFRAFTAVLGAPAALMWLGVGIALCHSLYVRCVQFRRNERDSDVECSRAGEVIDVDFGSRAQRNEHDSDKECSRT